jgi:hypothetical protein
LAQHDDKEVKARERRAQKFAENDAAEIKSAIQHLLTNRAGRRLLWWLLGIGQIGANPFRGVAAETDFNCGQLNVGLQIQAKIMEASPEGYLNMQKENDSDTRLRNDLILNGERTAADGTSSGQPGSYDIGD